MRTQQQIIAVLACFILVCFPLLAAYDGTTTGTITYAAGKFSNGGGGWSSSNYISLPNGAGNVPSTTSFAIEAWYKSSTTGYQAVISNFSGAQTTNSIGIYGSYGSGGLVCIIGSGTVASAGGTTTDGNWHHLLCDLNGTTVRAFVDGVIVGTNTTTFTSPSLPLRIGVNPSGGDAVNGEIDEIAIWNTSQRTANFTAPTAPYTGSESNLRALYHLNSNALDSAGGSGTLTAGTLSGAVGLDFTAATGGTSPYSYQLQSYTGACAAGTFTNDGSALTGQTSTALFARTGATVRCFRVVVTDAASATANSNSVTAPASGGGGMSSK